MRGLRDLGVRRFAALTGVLISFAVIGALLDVAIFLTGLAIMVVAAVITTVFVWPQIKQLSRRQRAGFFGAQLFGFGTGVAVIWALTHPRDRLPIAVGIVVAFVALDVVALLARMLRRRHQND